ncbi:hypothetical protein HDE76_003966 [Rhodanobacter sp. ANJX3]|uniref:hypothetical protein n=1 Tax=unclassified Rhodanobacter TaxID=2621553 RepID=UPI0015CDF5FE|nr:MULTISPECIES: hypothetical protein [unclassified Rhodanobacter]MBB5360718.1 hypothetical protein [Rhodanobacter sp. ANJX3]NYE30908.1 hypothetical protein [Rhodanobacter sp. K2T2]
MTHRDGKNIADRREDFSSTGSPADDRQAPSRPLRAKRRPSETKNSGSTKIYFRHASGVPFMSAAAIGWKNLRAIFKALKYLDFDPEREVLY